MNTPDSAFAYHQSTAFGASAVGQVVALYDTILRDFHRALAAIEAGQIEPRVNASNHALTVIGELQGVLDFERGGDAAQNLDGFYNVARPMIIQANIMNSREKFEELISMFTRLRAAWSKIESTVAHSEPTEHLRISSKSQPALAQNELPAPDDSRTSGNGRWSA